MGKTAETPTWCARMYAGRELIKRDLPKSIMVEIIEYSCMVMKFYIYRLFADNANKLYKERTSYHEYNTCTFNSLPY